MNNLSWMLYLADVAGGLQSIFTVIAIMAGGAFGILCGTAGILRIDSFPDQIKTSNGVLKLALYRVAPVFVISGLLGSLIPSPTTIYAIAASEIGEEVLDSKTGNKAVQALDAWLDRQIDAGDGEDVE